MNFIKSIPVTSDMVSLWVPSGTGRAVDIIRGNHGQCEGTHPNVPVIRKDSALGSLDYDNLSGTFTVGEDITGGTSSAFGVIVSDDGSTLVLKDCTGLFNNNEEITGVSSEATADVNQPDGAVGVDGRVKNGAFADDNDPPNDWTAVNATLTTEADGQVGNCLMVTESGASTFGYTKQATVTVVGNTYELTAYFKNGTADSGKIYLGTSGGGNEIYNSGGLTDASWTQYTHTFKATTTVTHISLWCIGDNDTAYFDEVSLYKIDRKQLLDTSLGWHFDNTDDYISHTEIAFTGEYTLFGWINRSNFSSLDPLFAHATETGKVAFKSKGDKLHVVAYNGAGNDETITVNRDLWNFIVVTRDSSNKVDAYINVGSANRLFSDVAQSGTLKINRIGYDGTNYFNECAAILGCTNTAWSTAQVNNFYLATKGLFSPRG